MIGFAMTAFALHFSNGTTLAIDGGTVRATEATGATTSATFESPAVAMVAFEAEAQTLERQRHDARGECSEDLPGALADLGCDDDRTWIVVQGGRLKGVHVYEADPVSCENLQGEASHAAPWRSFDPETAPGEVLGVHALRRLLAHPATAQCPRFGIEAWGPYIEPLLERLSSAGRAHWLTHLWLHDPWDGNRGALSTKARALGSDFPNLRVLYVPLWTWPLWCEADMRRLDRLTLGHGPQWVSHGKQWPAVPPLGEILDGVARRTPALRQLAVRSRVWNRDEIELLAAHPLLQRLATLELFNVHHAFDHEAFLRSRPRFEHLSGIVLGSHLLPQETVARFADWPAVKLASWDRRELRAYDAAWDERPV
jgi:hypothetical protein